MEVLQLQALPSAGRVETAWMEQKLVASVSIVYSAPYSSLTRGEKNLGRGGANSARNTPGTVKRRRARRAGTPSTPVVTVHISDRQGKVNFHSTDRYS